MSFEAVRIHLAAAGVLYALIGGVAVAARGATRSTLDIDVLTTDTSVLKDDFWQPLRARGLRIDVRKGDFPEALQARVAEFLQNNSSIG